VLRRRSSTGPASTMPVNGSSLGRFGGWLRRQPGGAENDSISLPSAGQCQTDARVRNPDPGQALFRQTPALQSPRRSETGFRSHKIWAFIAAYRADRRASGGPTRTFRPRTLASFAQVYGRLKRIAAEHSARYRIDPSSRRIGIPTNGCGFRNVVIRGKHRGLSHRPALPRRVQLPRVPRCRTRREG
jgi:hypothetical protein